MAKKYVVTLKDEEREQLLALIGSGNAKARTLTHARIVLKADEGWQDPVICQALNVSIATIERVRKQFVFEGFEAALKRRRSKRVYSRKVDGEQEAHLVALVCSSPPEGYARWSLRPFADRVVQMKIIDSISHETVRQVLDDNELKPWRREEMKCGYISKRYWQGGDKLMNNRAPFSISVIVCAYTEQRWDQLINAIESIQKQTVSIAEIIVVVDYNPHLYNRLRLADQKIVLIENQEVKGLSGARNTGVMAATGNLIAFLDDDAIADPDWLARLTEVFGDKVLGVGGSVLPIWENNKPAWFPDEFYWTVGCSYLGLPVESNPVRNLMGGTMCIRKEVFSAVGNFRSNLGHTGSLPLGCEETELCIRARQQWPHANFIYEPRARVNHHIPSNRASFAYFRSRCYAEGISKALVAKFVGSSDGLSAEREYTFKTLPKGILRGFVDAAGNDFSGLARAAAIILGLAFTTLGYVIGIFRQASIHNPNRKVVSTPL